MIKLTPGELVKIEMLQTLQEFQMRKGEQHLVLPPSPPPAPAPSMTVCSYLAIGPFRGCLLPANHPKPTSALRPARVESPVL